MRAVITHKGGSIDTGNYTTTIIEDANGMCLELDGTTVVLSKQMDDVYTGGYIFLYENRSEVTKLIKKWYHLTFLMTIMVNLFPVQVSPLKDSLL